MKLTAITLAAILGVAVMAKAETSIPSPLPGTYVHDFAGVIDDAKRAEIQAKAERLKSEYKTEIAIVTVESLEGEDGFEFSMRMARSWGIGSKDNDVRGLLVLVAIQDRKTAFRTSRHIEGELPDGFTGEISRAMNVYFKKGDFGAGLSLGMDKILERMGTAYEPGQATANTSGGGIGLLWLLVIGFPIVGIGGFILNLRKQWREAGSRAGTAGGRAQKSSAPDDRSSSSYNSGWSGFSSGSSKLTGSSSSYDSGPSYSGRSDFGGGGSDSSW